MSGDKKLTIKQENFCLAYIETGNASESYRRAYQADSMKPETITKRASELLQDRDVAGRLAELRKPVIEKAQVTLEQHLADLKRLRDDAWASEKYGPAIQAEISRGKASGHYIDRVESGQPGDFDKLDEDELESSILETARAIESARAASKASVPVARKATADKGK